MKRFTKVLLIVVALLSYNTQVYATNPPLSIAMKYVGDKSLALYLMNCDNQKTKISILDNNGSTLHSKTVKKQLKYAEKYNLRNLPSGQYLVEIRNEMITTSIPILIKDETISVLGNERITTFKPFMKHNNNEIDLMLFSPEKVQHQFTIYDENYNAIYNEVYAKEANIQKKFDIAALDPGDYSVVINSNGHKYIYNMSLR